MSGIYETIERTDGSKDVTWIEDPLNPEIRPTHKTRFTTKEFLSAKMVLDTEYDLFFASTDANIVAMQKRFLGRDEMIDVSDEQYTSLIALARSLNIIATDDRATELLKGIKT